MSNRVAPRSVSAAREQAHRQTAGALAWLLPRPRSWISAWGHGLCKMHVAEVMAIFDRRYHEHFGRYASADELYCAGWLWILDRDGRFSTWGEVTMSSRQFRQLHRRVVKTLEQLSA